jgi:hypothetical protein
VPSPDERAEGPADQRVRSGHREVVGAHRREEVERRARQGEFGYRPVQRRRQAVTTGRASGVRRNECPIEQILVTRATGNVGRQVVAPLRGTGCRIRALSRNPQSANLPDDVEVVSGDLAAPETLDSGLKGVDTVFLRS